MTDEAKKLLFDDLVVWDVVQQKVSKLQSAISRLLNE